MSINVTVPNLGESIVEATVGRWLKRVGEPVNAGDPVVELETEKVNMEVAAPESGVLQSIEKQEGETVEVGDILARVDETAEARPETSTARSTGAGQRDGAASTAPGTEKRLAPDKSLPEADANGSRATPTARRVAAEHGVNLSAVTGSGPSGRVTKEDVFAHLNQGPQQVSEPPAASVAETVPTPAGLEGRPEEIVRMSRRRLTIARRLVEAQHSAAMLTTFNQVDMSTVIALRKRHRDAFKERHGVGLGFMSFFTKATVGALKEFPRLNAEIQGDEMILKYYYDIGIAVGTEEGLVVPVVRNADKLSFAEIEREIADLAEKARTGRLSLPELQGGTFTITNGGIYGSLFSTPILNAPQVGILGMHNIEERPVAINGQVEIRPLMYLALSYDHRIVDGSEAVRFLVRIKEFVESPELLLLED